MATHIGGQHDGEESHITQSAMRAACYAQKLSFGFAAQWPEDQPQVSSGPLSVLNEIAWDYQLQWPAYLVIDRLALHKINRLFNFLIKLQVCYSSATLVSSSFKLISTLQIAQLALSKAWSVMKDKLRKHRQLNLPFIILYALLRHRNSSTAPPQVVQHRKVGVTNFSL